MIRFTGFSFRYLMDEGEMFVSFANKCVSNTNKFDGMLLLIALPTHSIYSLNHQ